MNGNDVEIRVYIQKNGQQKWMRTGMVARLTQDGIMTHEMESSQIKAYKLRNLATLRLLNYAASLAGYDRETT